MKPFFNYKVVCPERCCGNCAYSSFGRQPGGLGGAGLFTAERCAYAEFMECAFTLTVSRMNETPFQCERCGVCDKWLSRRISAMARDSGSFDEFRLRKAAGGFGETPTDELDEWFSERKATKKQEFAVEQIMHAVAESGKSVVLPAMANVDAIDEDGRICEVTLSDSFYSVQKWISENIDKYRPKPPWRWNENTETVADLSDFMM